MPPRTPARPPADRRADALTRDAIVAAAIRLLDRDGERGLTFRALAEALATGAGALYWHVANKEELLDAATERILAGALAPGARDVAPDDALRLLALGLFDAIDAHPWGGAHLASSPWQPTTLLVYERVGERLDALGVPARAQFFAASAVVSYVLGVGSQNAANARQRTHGEGRGAFLATAAATWAALDPGERPFVRRMAAELGDHDDREQFLAGIDLILAGLHAARAPSFGQAPPRRTSRRPRPRAASE